MNILVTGGAGFVGSFLVDELIKKGHDVTIFDNLEPQVHQGKMPSYINKTAKFIKGDLKDYNAVKESIQDKDIIFHLGAMVGVGQSMYDIRRYVEVNSLGTANLMEALINQDHNVKKLIVASSMSTYGEGAYKCESCGNVNAEPRPEEQMKNKDFEVHCPKCSKILKPIPVTENKKREITSIYALTKKDQEEMCLCIGKNYGIPTVALRYFNIFGPRQSLSNPYTGVVAIFMSRIKNNKPPLIFEDGKQTRDFISVHDITQANILAMEKSSADYDVFNVGAGRQISILQIAETLAKLYKKEIKPEITNQFRKGDIRYCMADISKIKSKLGFELKVPFEDGIKRLIEWSDKEEAKDEVELATKELKEKGLLND